MAQALEALGRIRWTSKTMWLNVLTLAAMFLAQDEVRTLIDPAVLVKIQAALNIVLRLVTTQPILAPPPLPPDTK